MTQIKLPRLLIIIAALFIANLSVSAQDTKPLLWGADPDGGIPYVFQDPDDPQQTIGFEMDIANALAKVLARPITFVKRSYESLLSDLERGDIDLAMNGIEILPERLRRVRFTKPYYLYQLQLVVQSRQRRRANAWRLPRERPHDRHHGINGGGAIAARDGHSRGNL